MSTLVRETLKFLKWRVANERGGFRKRWPGVSSDTFCTWCNKPCRGCCGWQPGNVRGGVVPHPANEGGLTAWPGLHFIGLLCCSR